MRFLTALMLAFMVFVSLPTLVAADVDAPMEQTADSPDVDSALELTVDGFDAVVATTRDFDAVMLVYRPARRVARPVITGPNGFQTGIWRPVDRIESTPTHNYESGVFLIRC